MSESLESNKLRPEWPSQMRPNAEIMRQTRINNIPIQELEQTMRPNAAIGITSSICFSGFLDRDQSLLSLMASDNQTVLKGGSTHRKIALELDWWVQNFDQFNFKLIERNRQTYYARRIVFSGGEETHGQESPFNDETKTNIDIEIIKATEEIKDAIARVGISNAERFGMINRSDKLKFSGLLPEMIGRYGFYEGNTDYRLDPKKVFEFFPYLRESPTSKSPTVPVPQSSGSPQPDKFEILKKIKFY